MAQPKAMLIRIRSRDGLERVSVDSRATVMQLQQAIEKDLNIPISNQHLSRNQALLLAKDAHGCSQLADMNDPCASLSALGLGHGSLVFLAYQGERVVPGPQVNPAGVFGKKMTMDDLIARQTRIERQENPHCTSLSFDRDSANAFQLYVHEVLAFGVKRGGFMYGTVSAEGDVAVNFIYEPPQQGSEQSLLLLRDPEEEKHADAIAAGLGMTKLGFVFTQTVSQIKQDYILSGEEIRQAVELHAENGSKEWATAVVKLIVNEEEAADVHFEAFQLSDQCVKLWREGWFVSDVKDLDPKLSRMKQDVVILGKDTKDVDNDLFLVPVKILDHQGPLACSFPIENRISQPNLQSLKIHLERTKALPYVKRLSDFHLLLFLSSYLDANTDVPQLAEAIRSQGTIADGYQLIIDSLASGF